jgi:outer membrane protein
MRTLAGYLLIASCAVLLLWSAAAAQPPSEPWTLDRCVNEALRKSPRLQASGQTVRGAEAGSKASFANRLPTFGVGGAYSYTSQVQQIQVPITIPGVHISPIQFGDGNVYDFTATARLPLYTGGTLSERSKADASAFAAARQDFSSDSLKLVYDVRRAYFNALGTAARADAARASQDRLARHVKEITNAKAVGTMSDESRITALASLRQAEGSVITADAALKAANLALGNLIGQAGEEITPVGELDHALVDSTGPIDMPLDSRVEIRSMNSRIEQTRHLVGAQRGSLLPALSGNATYHYGKPGVNFEQNQWMDYYVLGLNATWTLWDFKARSYQVAQVKASQRALEARKQDLINALRTAQQTTRETYLAARSARDRVAERADLQRLRLTLVEGRLKNGMASESEYLDAQTDLTTAETDLASANAQLRLSEADLLYASGY